MTNGAWGARACAVHSPGGRRRFRIAPVGRRNPGGPGRTVEGVSALLRGLPSPARADIGLTIGLLFLSVVSTAGIEVFDPIPGDLRPWR